MSEPESPNAGVPRSRKALEVFLSLEEKRTYRAVSEQMGVSLATVKRWAKNDNWQAKARERDAAFVRRLADECASNRMARTERNLRIVEGGLIRLAKDIRDGKTKTHLADLPRLVQLERELSGDNDVGRDASGDPWNGRTVVILPDNGRDKQPDPEDTD